MFELFSINNNIFLALIAGIGISVLAGVVGCFVIWRRLAYLGDSISHSTALGLALGFISGLDRDLSSLVIAWLFVLSLFFLRQLRILTTDTLLGILAHSFLSIGIFTASLLSIDFDIHSYLFGNLIAVKLEEIFIIYIVIFISSLLLYFNWSSLLLLNMSEDIARCEGVKILFIELLFLLFISLLISISVHIVGTLLVISLLLIPAGSARLFSNSPEEMVLYSGLIAIISLVCGIFLSVYFDTLMSPSIVVVSASIFILLSLICYRRT